MPPGYYTPRTYPETTQFPTEGTTSKTTAAESQAVCVVCQEEFNIQETIQLVRLHRYCHPCIQKFFQRSILDEQLFPPKCCRSRIDIELVEDILSKDVITSFRNKTIENATQNPIYCSDPQCSKHIPKENIKNDQASCSICKRVTCVICKVLPIEETVQPTYRYNRLCYWQQKKMGTMQPLPQSY